MPPTLDPAITTMTIIVCHVNEDDGDEYTGGWTRMLDASNVRRRN